MFYRDFFLNVDNSDTRHFMNQLIILLHENHHKFPVALALPKWKDGNPTPSELSLVARDSNAHPGKVLRMFADNSALLDSAVATLRVGILFDRGILTSTPTLPVPKTAESVAFYRWRAHDNLKTRVKYLKRNGLEGYQESVKELADAVFEEEHRVLYVPVKSSVRNEKNKTGRMSLRMARLISTEPQSTTLDVGSYGISRKSNIVWLPHFG